MIKKSITSLGDRLQQLRRVSNLTQEAVAEKTGIRKPQLGLYELGAENRIPNAKELLQLALIYNVSIDFLVRGDIDNYTQVTLKDAELITLFKRLEVLSDDKKNVIKEFITEFTS
jgi:transcriptional regulator with XRE-family HTH domain